MWSWAFRILKKVVCSPNTKKLSPPILNCSPGIFVLIWKIILIQKIQKQHYVENNFTLNGLVSWRFLFSLKTARKTLFSSFFFKGKKIWIKVEESSGACITCEVLSDPFFADDCLFCMMRTPPTQSAICLTWRQIIQCMMKLLLPCGWLEKLWSDDRYIQNKNKECYKEQIRNKKNPWPLHCRKAQNQCPNKF